MGKKFNIRGIAEPGKINVKLDGRFTDVDLYSASDETLEKLYADGCPYVCLSPSEFMKRNPHLQSIDVKKINIEKKSRIVDK